MINRGLWSISLVILTACFSLKISYRHGTCIVQEPIYMCLLTIACLHNKAAVEAKMPVSDLKMEAK